MIKKNMWCIGPLYAFFITLRNISFKNLVGKKKHFGAKGQILFV